MKQPYLRFVLNMIIAACLLAGSAVQANSQTVSDSTKYGKTKITDTRKNKPAYLKNGVRVNFVPFKPAVDKVFGNTSAIPPQIKELEDSANQDDKILNNVKVYPNPVTDQLNLTYAVSKESIVTIMIMDVLGNEVATLFSERLSAGQQNNSFNIASKLSSGFYFVRINVGAETVIKRISVL